MPKERRIPEPLKMALERLSEGEQQALGAAILATLDRACDRAELYPRGRKLGIRAMNQGDKVTA